MNETNETVADYQMTDTFAITPFRKGLNIELFDEIKREILAYPEHFDMVYWLGVKNDAIRPNAKAVLESSAAEWPCGTTACIAGWAVVLDAKQRDSVKRLAKDRAAPFYGDIEGVFYAKAPQFAMEALGINDFEAEDLFHRNRWPEQYRTSSDDAVAACKRIDHFITTGE